MIRRSQQQQQGLGRGCRKPQQKRAAHLDEQTIRGMELLGPLFTVARNNRLYELGGLSKELACPLPISTRGIGFMISKIIPKLQQQFPESFDEIPDPAVLYRASLAHLQEKLDVARAHPLQFPVEPGTQLYDVWPSPFAIDRAPWILESNCINLSPIALVINSIGNFQYNNKQFGSVFMKEPSPLNLQITNLRKYCEEMSNPETDPVKRVAGFELNSIPTAIWERKDENDPKSVVLANPDDIISPDYNHNSLSRDLIKIHQFVDKMTLKQPELRGVIDYKREGDPGQLVSTHVIPGKSLRSEKNVIRGDESIFWSRDFVDHDAWAVGVVTLVGEVLNSTDGGHRSNYGGTRCFLNWNAISDMIL